MNWNRSKTLLVTGASGHLGRRVVEILLDAEAGPIVATTRSPEKLAVLADRGAEIRRADFNDPASLDEAFDERTDSCSSRPTRSAIACRSTAPRSAPPSALA